MKMVKKQQKLTSKRAILCSGSKKVMFLMIMLMSISLISSMEFDNWKYFNESVGKYGKVRIENAFGLGETLVELELKKNTDICFTDCSAEKEIKLYNDGALVDDVRFLIKQKDKTWDEGDINEYQFYIKTGEKDIVVQDYKNVYNEQYDNHFKEMERACHMEKDGTHIEKEPIWEIYNLEDEVVAGTYLIKLEGKKDFNEEVDWQITSQGRLIDEWALWGAGFGQISYYNFTEGSGTNAADVFGRDDFVVVNSWESGCILENCYDVGDTEILQAGTVPGNIHGDDEALTFNFWIKQTGSWVNSGNIMGIITNHDSGAVADGEFILRTKGGQTTFETVFNEGAGNLKCTTTAGVTLNEWSMLTLLINSSNVILYQNGTIICTDDSVTGFAFNNDALNMWGDEGLAIANLDNALFDELSIWNRTLTPTEVTELYNNGLGTFFNSSATTINITMNSPENNTITYTNLTFNCSANRLNGLLNLTLIIDDVNNFTVFNTTNNQNLSFEVSKGFAINNYSWNCRSVDINDNIETSDTRYFDISYFTTNTETYSATVLESSEEDFSINISYESVDWNSIIGKLQYNGTNYTGTQTGTGDTIIFNRTIDIPPLPGQTAETKVFNWVFTFTNSTGSTSVIATEHTQTVNPITFESCNATGVAFINFSTYSAINPFPSLNATFKSSWRIKETTGTGNNVLNRSFEDVTEENKTWSFCLLPANKNYTITADIEIDAIGYAKNWHYLSNISYLGNSTQNVSLYLLNDSLATLTVLQTVNEAQQAISDVIIQVQLYDIGTDTFYTTAMAKTDFKGEDLVYLNWYDSFYKFIMIKDNVIVTKEPYKIAETPQTFEFIAQTDYVFQKFEDFLYTLVFNNVTNNFVLTFTKPSGLVEQGCLRVIKRNVTNDYIICTTCESSSSATLYCNIGGWGNGTFIATFYATGSFKSIDAVSEFKGEYNKIYQEIGNLDGTIMAIMLAGVIMSLFFVTPVLGVLGLLVGVLVSYVLGFQPLDYGTFITLVLIGGVVMWILKK